MNRLFVNFAVYSTGSADNHSYAYVATEDSTYSLGNSITVASRRRIERLVRNASKHGLEVGMHMSDLSVSISLYNKAQADAEAEARIEEYLRG